MMVPLALASMTAGAGAGALIEAAGSSAQPYSIIGTVVTPVTVLGFLLLGKLRTEGEVKRLEASCARLEQLVDRKDEQLRAMQLSLEEKAIPSLTRATLVLETLTPLLQVELRHRRPGESS